MDNEAGLEHISRRTTQDVDVLFVISDNSARSVRSAGRVKKLLEEIKTKVNKVYLIMTKTSEQDVENLREEIDRTGLELIGIIPADPTLVQFDIKGRPLSELPADSPAVKVAFGILDRLKI